MLHVNVVALQGLKTWSTFTPTVPPTVTPVCMCQRGRFLQTDVEVEVWSKLTLLVRVFPRKGTISRNHIQSNDLENTLEM